MKDGQYGNAGQSSGNSFKPMLRRLTGSVVVFNTPYTGFRMTRPVIATVGILNFFNNWKEFSFALVFINSERKKTLPLGLYNFLGAYTTDYAGL
ncbi:MAG: hypothetical protein LBF75_07750, partial [Treponema sp.]|nr:hypothetical protein [Treponema sp.]